MVFQTINLKKYVIRVKVIFLFVEHFFRLSGNVHSVVTGLSIHYKMEGGYKERLTSEVTQVKMAKLNDLIIHSYVATGEPL